ncbi:hypothetical protein AX14_003187 [Amanita brunnescens Koide BX004]|nr:hypothetical protein AX14_003187 [Amanita brunnescens Koide BX004]
MPPKTAPSKAPVASYLKSAPIAPPAASQTQPSTQPASAGKTKLASAGIPDTTTLQAKLEDLREMNIILEEEYRKKSSAFKELSRSHIALQGKFEHLTAQLERVSAQLAASQPAPAPVAAATPPHPMTKDYASCRVQTDPTPVITVTSPKSSGQQSFAQAVKAPAPRPSDKPIVASTPVPTSPIAPDSASCIHTPEPFKGRRATKSNKLHIQLRSRADFNSSMLKYTDLKLNHRHALLTAFINAISTKINKKTHSFFLDNRIEATFWSPRGNLIIRTKRTPSVQLQTLLLDTLEMRVASLLLTSIIPFPLSVFNPSLLPTLRSTLLHTHTHPPLCLLSLCSRHGLLFGWPLKAKIFSSASNPPCFFLLPS